MIYRIICSVVSIQVFSVCDFPFPHKTHPIPVKWHETALICTLRLRSGNRTAAIISACYTKRHCVLQCPDAFPKPEGLICSLLCRGGYSYPPIGIPGRTGLSLHDVQSEFPTSVCWKNMWSSWQVQYSSSASVGTRLDINPLFSYHPLLQCQALPAVHHRHSSGFHSSDPERNS